MHLEAKITVDRPRADVFDYLARAENLPSTSPTSLPPDRRGHR
jgi:hypothetical protein